MRQPTSLLVCAALTGLLSSACYAQGKAAAAVPAASAASASSAASAQPKSGLGKSVDAKPKPVEVVVPRPHEVVSETVNDFEETQLTDDEYQRLKTLMLRRERQRATPYNTIAKPTIRTLPVNLDPGNPPPSLRMTRGQLTSVVFSDISGNPWFIEAVAINRSIFGDGRDKDGKADKTAEATNVLTIEPLTAAPFGNASVKLKGLATPVIFMLTSAQKEVDVRVDARIPGHNPDAAAIVTNFASMPNIDMSLTGFLDGVPPKDAKRMHVTGMPNTDAWMYQDNLYLRTDADAQYPAYLSAARSTSGLAVYRFTGRQNSVTLLANGRAVTVFIED